MRLATIEPGEAGTSNPPARIEEDELDAAFGSQNEVAKETLINAVAGRRWP
jgi:hypothetical protein